MSKLIVLTQDSYRWKVVDYSDGEETELESSDGAYVSRGDAMADIEALREQHPDATFSEERTVVERSIYRQTTGDDAEYQRGYADAKRELLEKLA